MSKLTFLKSLAYFFLAQKLFTNSFGLWLHYFFNRKIPSKKLTKTHIKLFYCLDLCDRKQRGALKSTNFDSNFESEICNKSIIVINKCPVYTGEANWNQTEMSCHPGIGLNER